MNSLVCDSTSSSSILQIRDFLYTELTPVIRSKRTIVIICIGTDRSTGDSLGPLVGYKLKCLVRKNLIIYGDLEEPIHAKNLVTTLESIKSQHNNPYIVAIDASLGKLQNVGNIYIEKKPLFPGMALNKGLPSVGDLSITGIVNISGNFEFMVLQNTRLFTVMTIADTISKGIYHFAIKSLGGKNSSLDDVLNNISSSN
ncbi:spore protease YyaC [Clostridium paridis]|uniref:Spore protease YyaC n=1 Tax=Clostridium paridis TaxID=2803863 RepID=A0A937FEI1_9CLOT|nr:spore protease YyaC [Clostridium paridis]MBL4930498.1 spore protease YyaC [Clostridium paridis]